jgi:hypothetical protein
MSLPQVDKNFSDLESVVAPLLPQSNTYDYRFIEDLPNKKARIEVRLKHAGAWSTLFEGTLP